MSSTSFLALVQLLLAVIILLNGNESVAIASNNSSGDASLQECSVGDTITNEYGNDDEETVEASETATTIKTIPFPIMPPKIRAILHEDWDILDPRGQQMINAMRDIDGAVEFAHARTTFFDHLKGTFGILSAWDQPLDVRRTGLVHTAYSGDLFMFYLFDSNLETERDIVVDLLGEEAEALTYLFGTIDRGSLFNFKEVQNDVKSTAKPLWAGTPLVEKSGSGSDSETNGRNGYDESVIHTVFHRGSPTGTWDVHIRTAAHILMVTIADYLDQMVETNGWKDHHQIENGGSNLYPGNGMPALGFYWFTAICNGIKDYVDVVPPIFNHCETVITYDEDKEARDTYWKVIMEEKQLSEEEQIALLNRTVELNPFIGEPNMLLSQIYYRQEKYYHAAVAARSALEKFYTLASAWDKRRSFNQWVAFSRVLMLRANRMLEGKEQSLPCKDPNNPLYVNYNKLKLTNLRDVVNEMNDREE